MAKQSALILELKIAKPADHKAVATVVRKLKGEGDEKTVNLTLSTCGVKEQIAAVEKLLAAGDTQAILFVGEFNPGGPGEGPAPGGTDAAGGGEQKKARAFLHVGGQWVTFFKGAGGALEMDEQSSKLLATWNGGTDMLVRATEYILANPETADMPTTDGASWASQKKFATIAGAVRAVAPVDLAGDGKWTIFVACDKGDRLFRHDEKSGEMADVTPVAKLASKSQQFAWGDFNGDGKLDLLSWDGKALNLYAQSADGTFAEGKTLLDATSGVCVSLSCVDAGGKAAVIIATTTTPLLWIPGEDKPKPVGRGAVLPGGVSLGQSGPCVVADFDNDGLPDIIQLFAKGGLVYQGKAPGQFADAKSCDCSAGEGQVRVLTGDFDGDGRLDIVAMASKDTTRLWSNQGGFKFTDAMDLSGELSYKGKTNAVGGACGDFNNDGRQDLVFCYAELPPQLYFNRGFRSFGYCNKLDPATNNLLPQETPGQQAICLADVNGDSTQDLVTVLNNGGAWVVYVDSSDHSARCLRATVPVKSSAGPVLVSGWRGDGKSDKAKPFCLGAWNVTPGSSEAFFGISEAGPVTLKWQFPGGKPQEKTVTVEDRSVRVVLDAK
jgi:hypothetical protein